MRWRFEDMATLVRVVDAGGISAAATELHLSKSVVSKRVSDLEKALGVVLLRRSTRRVVPTQQGLLLYERMREALRDVDAAVEAATDREGKPCGRLRITAPMSFGTLYLAGMLAAFARRYPDVELSIDLDDRMLDLARDGYDLAIRIGRLPDSRLVARKLCESPRVVCCSPTYARARKLPATIEALAEHVCIGYENAPAGRLWQFATSAAHRKQRAITPPSRITANNGEVVRDMAIAGLGLAILPLFIVADALRTGKLIPVLPEEKPLPDTIYAVYPPTRQLPRRVRVLIDHLAAELAHGPISEQSGGKTRPEAVA